ncbi:LAFE_0H11034g1_1 [Lachancea fermentati]|uniref:LAFE_0H11034g1_1 n=1 Tax=Lachancea fermentati TaxID=4955 RepID=A0A1G4MKA9_LACFM|nr:LAFE_0H11034g1_1 [Lachancea fermentati]
MAGRRSRRATLSFFYKPNIPRITAFAKRALPPRAARLYGPPVRSAPSALRPLLVIAMRSHTCALRITTFHTRIHWLLRGNRNGSVALEWTAPTATPTSQPCGGQRWFWARGSGIRGRCPTYGVRNPRRDTTRRAPRCGVFWGNRAARMQVKRRVCIVREAGVRMCVFGGPETGAVTRGGGDKRRQRIWAETAARRHRALPEIGVGAGAWRRLRQRIRGSGVPRERGRAPGLRAAGEWHGGGGEDRRDARTSWRGTGRRARRAAAVRR